MHPIRSYVVRIYRRDRRVVAGLVEDVRTGKSTAFRSLAELLEVLMGRARGGRDPEPDSRQESEP
jgi:hypothetical protein